MTMQQLHAAILICTYRRPQKFAELIASLRRLDVPEGVAVTVCVADNNPASELDGYIRAPLASLPFATLAAHEAKTGYSSARNRSLALGLKSEAGIFLTTDDDLLADANWLRAHLAACDKYAADIVCGWRGRGRIRHEEGAVLERVDAGVGTNNLSFRRHVVAPEGLGLSFDTGLDDAGGEDLDFLERARQAGARIVWSSRPRVHPNEPSWEEDPEGAFATERNLAALAGLNLQNDLAAEVGARRWDGVARRCLKLPGYLIGAAACWLAAMVMMSGSRRLGLRQKALALKNLYKVAGIGRGLLRKPSSRRDLRHRG